MNNKRNIFIAFLLFTIMCTACKNKAVEYYEFKITDEKIQPKTNGVVASGTYSYGSEVEGIEFNYGLDKKLTDAVSKSMNLKGFDFSVSIDSLKPNTLYYYCYKVDFGINKDYLTEIDSFGTHRGVPEVETIKVIAVDDFSCQVKCRVISNGGDSIKERGIYWNTVGGPSINDHKVISSENNSMEYYCPMNNLEPNTIYFIRAYARNNEGTGLGVVVDFQTGNNPELPKVITSEVSEITATSAQCGGEVTNDGGSSVSSRGVCWSTEHNPTLEDDITVDGAGFGTFVSNLTNLVPNTNYYIKAYAIIKDQNNTIDTVYGEIKSFTTLSGGGPYTPITVVVNATPTIIPEGEISRLTASAAGGDGNYSYLWTPATSLDNPNTQSPIASPTVTTTYTCTVTSDNNTASNSCTITVVKAPANLKAIVQNENEVLLNWTNANPAQTYRIYRNDTYLAQTDNTTYMDGNLSPDIYRYQVTSLYEGVESPKSHDAVVEIISQIPEGALEYLFTVGSNNKQIWFSSGNLQYRASTNTWRFATKQYDRIGSGNANISSTYDGWIDLFGWGTSGFNHGAICYQPWSTSEENSDYFAYGASTYNLTGEADWGYNAIVNGGCEVHQGWRTLTSSEWNYLLNERETPSNIRYAKAKVNGIPGLVILPDDWEASFYPLNYTNDSGSDYNGNDISVADWTSLQIHGAVFLPAGGKRSNTGFYNRDVGHYWSSIQNGDSGAYCLYFRFDYLTATYSDGRHYGLMVRLVFDKP